MVVKTIKFSIRLLVWFFLLPWIIGILGAITAQWAFDRDEQPWLAWLEKLTK